jgi:methionyl-tRNA synthetase
MTENTGAAADTALVSIQDFARIKLKVGEIREATAHPGADKLLLLKVDLGEGTLRPLVAGIRAQYQPETLVGRKVVVVSNLQPAVLRGERSEGMVLAAVSAEGCPILLTVDGPAPNGAQVR